MTGMRKPIDNYEVELFFYGWKSIFTRALEAHIGVSYENVVEHAAAVHVVVRNAAIFADAALEKMVERLDELKVVK